MARGGFGGEGQGAAGSRTRKLREGQLLTYLHLAPDVPQTEELLESGATCIAYETVTDALGGLPLLAPMSKVAGRMAVQAGAHCLESPNGGAGILLGGVPGVASGRTVVIGGGVVGENAIEMAIGLGSQVTVLDRDLDVLDRLSRRFGAELETVYSTNDSLEAEVLAADLVIGAVLVKGATAPKLVTEELVKRMKPGSVLVDVAIDQGGCFETSRPTTHATPTYVLHDVVHYCVANMPGAVPRTSTYALNNATLPFTLALADQGPRDALLADAHFLGGLNICGGCSPSNTSLRPRVSTMSLQPRRLRRSTPDLHALRCGHGNPGARTRGRRRRADHNIRTIGETLPGPRLRPHVKAFKSTALARRLADAGHRAFTCATVREVEGMAAAGLGDDLPAGKRGTRSGPTPAACGRRRTRHHRRRL